MLRVPIEYGYHDYFEIQVDAKLFNSFIWVISFRSVKQHDANVTIMFYHLITKE